MPPLPLFCMEELWLQCIFLTNGNKHAQRIHDKTIFLYFDKRIETRRLTVMFVTIDCARARNLQINKYVNTFLAIEICGTQIIVLLFGVVSIFNTQFTTPWSSLVCIWTKPYSLQGMFIKRRRKFPTMSSRCGLTSLTAKSVALRNRKPGLNRHALMSPNS